MGRAGWGAAVEFCEGCGGIGRGVWGELGAREGEDFLGFGGA